MKILIFFSWSISWMSTSMSTLQLLMKSFDWNVLILGSWWHLLQGSNRRISPKFCGTKNCPCKNEKGKILKSLLSPPFVVPQFCESFLLTAFRGNNFFSLKGAAKPPCVTRWNEVDCGLLKDFRMSSIFATSFGLLTMHLWKIYRDQKRVS